jgi:hypothetical protein
MRLHAQTGEIIFFRAGEPDRSEVRPTLRWREMDSNHWSPAEFGNFDVSKTGSRSP